MNSLLDGEEDIHKDKEDLVEDGVEKE